MQLTSAHILSLVPLTFYIPSTLLSIILCFRHGFTPNTGFIFLSSFLFIRTFESALKLASIYVSPTQAGILNTATLVLSFTGISSLLLATLGLVYRVRCGMAKIYPTAVKPVHFVLLGIPVLAALVLCDIGAIDYGTRVGAKGSYIVPIALRIGVVMFLVITATTAFIAGLLFRVRLRLFQSDQYVLFAVAVSLPFVFARVGYGFLGAFTRDAGFGSFGGNVLLTGGMSILPEMVVVVVYSTLGVILPRRVVLPTPSPLKPEQEDLKPKQERRKTDIEEDLKSKQERRTTKIEENLTPKQEKRKTKIVLVKPWKVVDFEGRDLVVEVRSVEIDRDDVDVDDASIRGRVGENPRNSGEKRFVPPESREGVAGKRYIGIMTPDYLPPLALGDSAIAFDTQGFV